MGPGDRASPLAVGAGGVLQAHRPAELARQFGRKLPGLVHTPIIDLTIGRDANVNRMAPSPADCLPIVEGVGCEGLWAQ
jgi:hypothetical protein